MDSEDHREVAELGVGDLLGIGMGLIVLVIGIAFGLQITGEIRDDLVTGSANCNASHKHACGAEYNATVDGIIR